MQVSATAIEIPVGETRVLRGLRLGEFSEHWALLVHEEGRDLDAWRGLVPSLTELTLCVLAVDLAGHGASDDPWEPQRLPADVLAVLRYVRSQGGRSIAVVAAGAGATAALAAAGELEVQAIVALSPRAALDGLDPEAIRKTTAPKLIIAGSEDPGAAAEAGDVFRRSIGWGLLQSLPTEIQGTALLESDWAGQVVENALAFLRDYV